MSDFLKDHGAEALKRAAEEMMHVSSQEKEPCINQNAPLVLMRGKTYIGTFDWGNNTNSMLTVELTPAKVTIDGVEKFLFDWDTKVSITEAYSKACWFLSRYPLGENPIQSIGPDVVWLKLDKRTYDGLVRNFRPEVTGMEKYLEEELEEEEANEA